MSLPPQESIVMPFRLRTALLGEWHRTYAAEEASGVVNYTGVANLRARRYVGSQTILIQQLRGVLARVGGVVGYRICLTHRRSSVRTWADSCFFFFSLLFSYASFLNNTVA